MNSAGTTSRIVASAARLKWWHIALISIAVSALGGLSGGIKKSKEQRRIYEQQEQAPWAPPGWVFAPVWTINNFLLLLALQKIIRSNLPQRRKLLLLQAGIWAIFFSFNYVYFNRRSPVLAAIWTQTDAVLALASMLIAAKPDRKLALYYLPLTLWTWFANSVADYQALKNPDPLLGTEAVME